MAARTPTFQLVDLKLGGNLHEFVRTRRGDKQSWRAVAKDIETATGIALSSEVVRLWFVDDDVSPVRGAAAAEGAQKAHP